MKKHKRLPDVEETVDNSCLFCKIANNTIGSFKVYEDDYVLAFLDAHPTSKGHTLVIPKEHFDNLATCPKDILDRVIESVQMVAQVQIAYLGATGVNILTNIGKSAGQTVNHLHFHVIPRYENDGLLLTFPTSEMEDEEMEEVANTIKFSHIDKKNDSHEKFINANVKVIDKKESNRKNSDSKKEVKIEE